jgi:hypothetical protein
MEDRREGIAEVALLAWSEALRDSALAAIGTGRQWKA